MSKIDLNQVNNLVLQKQHLTVDTKSDDILQITKDIGGLHATSPTTPYLSLFARMRNFQKDDLKKELEVKRSLGKIRCMRRTVYILTKEMIPVAFAATKKLTDVSSKRYSEALGVSPEQYEDTPKLIYDLLKGKNKTVRDIKKMLQTDVNISPIVNLMCDRGILIRGIPKTGWKSNIHTYHLLCEYFPDVNLNEMGEKEARTALINQYLTSFGPVTENDISWWTGFSKTQVRQSLKRIQGQFFHVEISDLLGDFIMLNSDEKLLKAQNIPNKRQVSLLPVLDPYLMGYKERDRYLFQKDYENIFDRSGNATSTILQGGRVIGVWGFTEDETLLVKIFLFKSVEQDVLRKIRFEAERIGGFISDKSRKVKVTKCDSMVPLTKRSAGRFITPLKNPLSPKKVNR